jgi:hypothetical protein
MMSQLRVNLKAISARAPLDRRLVVAREILDRREITVHESDDWECLCGNQPDTDGFYHVNARNEWAEPTPIEWTGRYGCASCGRVLDAERGYIVGLMSEENRMKEQP